MTSRMGDYGRDGRENVNHILRATVFLRDSCKVVKWQNEIPTSIQ